MLVAVFSTLFCDIQAVTTNILEIDLLAEDPGPKADPSTSTEVFVRIEQLTHNRKLVILADPDRIVQLHLLAGKISGCFASRRVSHESIIAESELAEERWSLPIQVQYLEVVLDLGWYARFCRRHTRNKIRRIEFEEEAAEEEEEATEELITRETLNKGLPGTNFCRTSSSRLPFESKHLGDNRPLDQCCLYLYSCGESIAPLQFLNSTLNADLLPVFSCYCTEAFIQCLKPLSDQGAQKMKKLWQSAGRCYNLQTRTHCRDYNVWFDECMEPSVEESVAVLQPLHI